MTQRVCAITGATGFVGNALAEKFAADGWHVIRLLRSPAKTSSQKDERAFTLGQDVDADSLANVDLLLHAAYDFSVLSWADIRRVNVYGSEKLFDAAAQAGVKRLIFISSMAAYEGCRSKYGRGKLAVEESARARGGISVRPGVIYSEANGGLAAKIEQVARKWPLVPMIGRGDYPLFMCHVDDLCELIARLAASEPPQEPITAAHAEAITLRGLAQAAKAINRPQIFLPVPWRLLYLLLRLLEVFGLRPGFRSDSVMSLVYSNPAVDLSPAQNIFPQFRSFRSRRAST